jgi:L-ascorbate metabolism protein UlaG (beta-lactamase superfamily)
MFISRPAPDVVALTDAVPLPGIGFLPVNAYVLYAREPVLIDTGLRASSPEFLEELWSLIEPADLRWVFLTHPDGDHTGSVFEILDAAPHARLVTTSPGMGLPARERRIPPGRVLTLNPGESLDVGDRRLLAFRPPFSDGPAKMGLIDDGGSTTVPHLAETGERDVCGRGLRIVAFLSAGWGVTRRAEGHAVWFELRGG